MRIGIALLALQLGFVAGCAKEQSAEDRRREQRQREFERLRPAEGAYNGFALADNNKGVPASVMIAVKQNPKDGVDSPTLDLTLRLGFFGGVTIAAESTSYDWGNGQVAASFKRTAGSPLELRGHLKDGQLTDVVVDGPNNNPSKLVVQKSGTSNFNESREYALALNESNSNKGSALLYLKRGEQDVAAPASSDLPILPPLEASLQFAGMSFSPQVVKKVQYDPLQGAMELRLRDASKIVFNNIFLQQDVEKKILLQQDRWEIHGDLVVGSKATRNVVASSDAGLVEASKNASSLPPKYFKGRFIGPGPGANYKAIGFLDFLGTQGTNSEDYPFANFPQMRLRVVYCVQDVSFQKEYSLIAVNHLDNLAQFRDPSPGTNSDVLEVMYSNNWQHLSGTQAEGNVGSGAGSRRVYQIELDAFVSNEAPTCATSF